MMKVCIKCGLVKSIDEFEPRPYNKFVSACKQCRAMRKYELLREKTKARGGREVMPTLASRELKRRGFKKCPMCKKIKKLKCFNKNKNATCGVSGYCKVCSRILGKRYHDPKRRREEYIRLRDVFLGKKLLRRFGITIEQYLDMERTQGFKCSICRLSKEDNGKRLAVDHCHKTGRVRGLLCNNCNVVVGFLSDKPEIARKMATYLEFWRTK